MAEPVKQPEAKAEATKFYKLIYREPKEYLGKKLNQNPAINEGGGTFYTGDVIELTSARMNQLGKDYFAELTEKEHKDWEDSKRTLRFPKPKTK